MDKRATNLLLADKKNMENFVGLVTTAIKAVWYMEIFQWDEQVFSKFDRFTICHIFYGKKMREKD